jgi:hypothetical protein
MDISQARVWSARVRLYTGKPAEPTTGDGETWSVSVGDRWPARVLDTAEDVERYIAEHEWRKR